MKKMTQKEIEQMKVRSAWSKGVKAYALELLEDVEVELTRENVREELLNGAENWSDYSYGGCALIYEGDIVERLCPPSEIKRFKNGKLNKPNSQEEWFDVQARALRQAFLMIINKL